MVLLDDVLCISQRQSVYMCSAQKSPGFLPFPSPHLSGSVFEQVRGQ